MNRELTSAWIMKNWHHIDWLQVGLIMTLAWLLIKAVEHLLPWLGNKLHRPLRLYLAPSVPVIRLLIILLAIIAITPLIIEPSLQNLVAILGATGLAIGFILKDFFSSIVAGIMVLYEHPYRVGDWVEIDGIYGEIKSLNLRTLRLVTPDDTFVTIPHAKIWHNAIKNANNGNRDLLCVTDFYLAPLHDAALVRQSLYDVAMTSPYLNLERPIVVVVAEQPWATHYKIKAYPMLCRDQFLFISDITIRGKEALQQLGVTQTSLWSGSSLELTH